MLSWTEQDAASFFLTEVDAKDAADQWTLAKALARGAHLLYGKHDYDRAVACFGDALRLLQQVQQQQQPDASSSTPLVALLHHHMGVAFHDDGHTKWALLMQKKALELAQRCGDAKLQARALKALGVLFLDRDEPHHALDCQQQALQIAVDTRDAELEARVHANLGNLAAAQDQFLHAIACHTRDLSACVSPQLDSAVGQARAHRNLAMVYATMDDQNTRQLQLDHELAAARLEASNAFETDMRRHAQDVVGNIYWQLTSPDERLASMVATSIQELLASSTDDDHEHREQTLPSESLDTWRIT
jgi:tetratricopeptide (TPR) repeat protein